MMEDTSIVCFIVAMMSPSYIATRKSYMLLTTLGYITGINVFKNHIHLKCFRLLME